MKKLLNKKGFTLMEMMIVVAIIVILVAISIPTFSGSLDSAKTATDAANLRSAKAAVALEIANGTKASDLEGQIYNIEKGAFEDTSVGEAHKGSCTKHADDHIVISSGTAVWESGVDCDGKALN